MIGKQVNSVIEQHIEGDEDLNMQQFIEIGAELQAPAAGKHKLTLEVEGTTSSM